MNLTGLNFSILHLEPVFNLINYFRGTLVIHLRKNLIYSKVVLLGLSLLFSAMSHAGKVVVFDHQEAILRTDIAQGAVNKVKESPDFKQLVQQGEAIRADLEALKKEYDTEGLTWSDEIKSEKNAEAEELQKKLQLAAKQAQSLQAAAVSGVAGDMQAKLEKILEDMIAAEKIDIILQKQIAYIAVPAADITAKVTEALNKSLAAKNQ